MSRVEVRDFCVIVRFGIRELARRGFSCDYSSCYDGRIVRVDESYVARSFAVTFASCSLRYANSKNYVECFGSEYVELFRCDRARSFTASKFEFAPFKRAGSRTLR